MTVGAMSWAFNLRMDDSTEKFVLLALADHADEHGCCWPSLKRLMLFTCCSESTVRRAVRRLEAQGIISSEERPGTSRMYRINLKWAGQNDSPQNDTPLQNDPPSPVTPETPPLSGVTPEPSMNHQRTTIADKRAKATQLPQDWKPTPPQIDYCRKQGCPSPNDTATDFREHFLMHGKRMVDWNLTWQTWCRRERQFKGYSVPSRPTQGGFNL